MNNSFHDAKTNTTYIIPANRQLTQEEAEECVKHSIAAHKTLLLQSWKSRKENENWEGDDSAKADELFNALPVKSGHKEVFIGVAPRFLEEG